MQRIYDQASIEELTGLSYADFEKNPSRALAQAGQSDAPELIARGFKPLLAAQARLRSRIDAELGMEFATSAQASVRSNVGQMHTSTERRRLA